MTPSSMDLLQSQLASLSLQDKIGSASRQRFGNFSVYLSEHPETLVELSRFVSQLPDGLTPSRVEEVFYWADTLGMEDVQLVEGEQTGLDILYRDQGQTVSLLGYPIEATPTAHALPKGFSLSKEFLEVEKSWMVEGLSSPVVHVHFRGQTECNDTGDIVASREEDRHDWDGTLDSVALAIESRNAALEEDTYESDALREGEAAPLEAQEWDGPYSVAGSLFVPGERLLSVRQALQLARQTQTPANPHKGCTARI